MTRLEASEVSKRRGVRPCTCDLVWCAARRPSGEGPTLPALTLLQDARSERRMGRGVSSSPARRSDDHFTLDVSDRSGLARWRTGASFTFIVLASSHSALATPRNPAGMWSASAQRPMEVSSKRVMSTARGGEAEGTVPAALYICIYIRPRGSRSIASDPRR